MASPEESIDQAFEEESNRLTAERLPIAGVTFIAASALVWGFEHKANPERDFIYAAFLALQTLNVLWVVGISRLSSWRSRVKPAGVIGAMAAIAGVAAYTSVVHSQAELLNMGILFVAIGTLVAMPWGWQGQLPVVITGVVSLAVALSCGTETNMSASRPIVGLAAIGALTVIGAEYLQRQRTAVFRHAAAMSAANEAMVRANQALEDANRTKNEFLANVSHELRTPLNIILGYADLLSDGEFGELKEEARDASSRIGRTCRTLVFLISDLLDLSRIEAGRLAIRPQPVDLAGLFTDMRTFVEPRLINKEVVFQAVPPEGVSVTADRDRIEQILINLLSNATKFTELGSIQLRARADGPAQVCIDVIDTGVGIAANELSTLFEPFRQGTAGKLAGGVGIGLSLSSRLASAMGGSLTVTSELGKGSTFTLSLPAEEQ